VRLLLIVVLALLPLLRLRLLLLRLLLCRHDGSAAWRNSTFCCRLGLCRSCCRTHQAGCACRACAPRSCCR